MGLASRLVVIVAVVWLAKQIIPLLLSFGDILLIFFLAWLVAFVLEPIATLLERLHLPRALAVMLIYSVLVMGAVLLVLFIAPMVLDQLGALRDELPEIMAQLPTDDDLSRLLVRYGLPADLLAVYHPTVLLDRLQASAGDVLGRAINVATGAATIVINLVLVTIISFYLLLDGRGAIRALLRLVPGEHRRDVILLLRRVSASFGGFLRGQVIQAVLFGLAVALFMIALRMDFMAVTALASGLLMLMPVVGPALALLPPLAAALLQPESATIVIVLGLIIVQAAIVNVLMPRILSGQMGMSPLLVFVAILFGLRIGGALGAFFGIPIMGVIYGVAVALLGRWRNQPTDVEDETAGAADTRRTNSS